MVAASGDSKGFDLQKLNKFSKSEILDPLVQEEKNLAAQLREGLSKLLDMHNPAELGSLCGAMGLVEECEFGTHAEKKAGVLRKVAQTGARYNSTERAHMECLETMWDGILYVSAKKSTSIWGLARSEWGVSLSIRSRVSLGGRVRVWAETRAAARE